MKHPKIKQALVNFKAFILRNRIACSIWVSSLVSALLACLISTMASYSPFCAGLSVFMLFYFAIAYLGSAFAMAYSEEKRKHDLYGPPSFLVTVTVYKPESNLLPHRTLTSGEK